MVIDEEIKYSKLNFLTIWILANAVGFTIAWPWAEIIGRGIGPSWGDKTGELASLLVFEAMVWTLRSLVLYKIREFNPLRPLDFVIWLGTEVFSAMIYKLPASTQESPIAYTFTAIFAGSFGPMAWITVWFMRISRARSKNLLLWVFMWTLIGLLVASLVASLIWTGATEIVFQLAKSNHPYLGMLIAGLALGGAIGAVTGLCMLQMMNWNPNT